MNNRFSFKHLNLRSVLLYQHRMISMGIMMIGLLIVLCMSGVMFFKNPSPAELSASTVSRSLETTSIDTLELWVEERQNITTKIPLTGRDYFIRSSVPH